MASKKRVRKTAKTELPPAWARAVARERIPTTRNPRAGVHRPEPVRTTYSPGHRAR